MEPETGSEITALIHEAQTRWLKPAEVLFILQNHENYHFMETTPQKPLSGSLFLYNKRVVPFFRKDGHTWRKKKTGRTVGEGHEKLKVANVESLNCYYAHGEKNPNFQRRSYWMLNPALKHIVLVHYREVHELQGRVNSDSMLVSIGCASGPSSVFCTAENQGSISAVTEPYRYQNSFSTGSIEVNSESFIRSNGGNLMDETGKAGEFITSPADEVNHALRSLETQLSLNNDERAETSPHYEENLRSTTSGVLDYGRKPDQDDLSAILYGSEYRETYQFLSDTVGISNESNSCSFQPNAGEYISEYDDSIWKELEEQSLNGVETNVSDATQFLFGSDIVVSATSVPVHQEVENSKVSPHTSGSTHEAVSYYVDQVNEPGISPGEDSRVNPAEKRFTIQEISPEWGYAADSTKVLITGYFLCDSTDYTWSCMFGDIGVPLQVIRDGVLLCQAPPQIPGKVSLCITSSNQQPCSELREFEYRITPNITSNCSTLESDVCRSTEELLLLVQFARMLLCDPLLQNGRNGGSQIEIPRIPIVDEDPWGHIIEALLVESKTPFYTMDWLVQELLKDKLHQWLSSRYKEGEPSSFCLSKEEQCIIHRVAGLGFDWALNPILNSGINVNYRDVNGWTALHWAAYYGREKMVAALIAAGASASAVTDPTSQDPVGKTPGSIADANGHKGLAGYLSEVALTSHLFSLTLKENDISRGSTVVEAERTMETISDGSLGVIEDQLSLKDSLAAVRNATQAASRIQSFFRAYSLERRRAKEVLATFCDEYGLNLNDIRGISAASHLTFPEFHDHVLNKAAISIQKKYRGWKRHQEFLALRQKIVMIQAYVRGYQVRKRYIAILWGVGVLDKVVLRWHRKRLGFRGFQAYPVLGDENDYEEMLKVFRKQKVHVAIENALSRVLSMVKDSEARKQYRRMLESYWKAKVELFGTTSEAASFPPRMDENKNNSMDESYYIA